jgi:hypothetical protein
MHFRNELIFTSHQKFYAANVFVEFVQGPVEPVALGERYGRGHAVHNRVGYDFQVCIESIRFFILFVS